MSGTWTYLASEQVYHNREDNTYASIDPVTKQWRYHARPSVAESSKMAASAAEDVGWGGLMEPEQLAAATAPSYDDPKLYAFPSAPERRSVSPEIPNEVLRLVVTESPPNSLTLGHIAVFDARKGGIEIGRDRILKGQRARLRIREMQVSKCHACIWYGTSGAEGGDDSGLAGWWLVDLGSTLGTFLSHPREPKQKRLSAAKHASKPAKLSHLSTITIGQTTLTVHIHPDWPCSACQLDGSNEIPLENGTSSGSKRQAEPEPEPERQRPNFCRKADNERKRKLEMRNLKAALLDPAPRTSLAEAGYVDRSAQRRRLHPPAARTERQVEQPAQLPSIPPRQDIGQALLRKQGWTPGSGLGSAQEGRVEPIKVEMLAKRAGLGTGGGVEIGQEGGWRDRGKQKRWGELNAGGD